MMKVSLVSKWTMVLCCLLMLSACSLFEKEEEATGGSIYGMITDAVDNKPIVGAQVQITPTGRTVTTGSDGSYTITDLPVGSYKMQVSAVGYVRDSRNIEVIAGQQASGDMTLQRTSVNTKIGIDKSELNFTSDDQEQILNISNLGNIGALNWKFNSIPEWLVVSETSGSIAIGKTKAVVVAVDYTKITQSISTYLILSSDDESVSIKINVSKSGSSEGGNDGGSDTDGDGNDSGDGSGNDGNDPIYGSEETGFCGPISFDSNYKVDFVSCKRNLNEVLIQLKVTSIGADRTFRYYPSIPIAYDDMGFDYRPKVKVGSDNSYYEGYYTSFTFPKDIPLNMYIKVEDLNEESTKFPRMILKFNDEVVMTLENLIWAK